MLLMPSTDINFQALADNVTADFFKNGVSLEDGVVKVAKEQSLNPEEVLRLVEKTNTAASCHFLKTSADKKGSFSLAHADLVLQRTHPAKEENEVEKTASVYEGLPLNKFAKTASESINKKHKNLKLDPVTKFYDGIQNGLAVNYLLTGKGSNDLVSLYILRNAFEDKKFQKTALEKQVSDRIDYLASEFYNVNGPDFTKFASDCAQVFGKTCYPVLDGLGKYLRADWKNLRKTAASVIDDTSPCIKAMSEICDGLKNIMKTASEIEDIKKAMSYYWKEAKRRAYGDPGK